MNGFSLWDRLSEEDRKKLQEKLGVKEPVDVKPAPAVVQK
jgi:hypothetical protein